jgi:hypothetical protein
LLEKELGKVSATKVIKHIKEFLHEQYPSSAQANSVVRSSPSKPTAKTIEARILQKLQAPRQQFSDIDSHFKYGAVTVRNPAIQDKEWLFWWRTHYHEYPHVAAAAEDYLAIPASEVAVERLFNNGRDLLGLRRHSQHGETMRRLMLLRHIGGSSVEHLLSFRIFQVIFEYSIIQYSLSTPRSSMGQPFNRQP